MLLVWEGGEERRHSHNSSLIHVVYHRKAMQTTLGHMVSDLSYEINGLPLESRGQQRGRLWVSLEGQVRRCMDPERSYQINGLLQACMQT